RQKAQLSAFLHRHDVFLQKAGLFTGVWFRCPFPVFLISPVFRVFESWPVACAVVIPLNCTSTVVEMEVSEEYIGNILPDQSIFLLIVNKCIIAPMRVMATKLFVLLVSLSTVYQDQFLTVFNQEGTGS